jgi:hypothetical protein
MISRKKQPFLHAVLALLAICALAGSAHADEVSDLIETILETSPAARAKAESYTTATAKSSPTKKAPKKKTPAAAKPTIPDLQIPEEDLLEVDSKFPENFIGKYVYGPVTFRALYDYENGVMIGFDAKNWRSFWIETGDTKIIAQFSQLRWGMKFTIPREFPLRVVEKFGFNYILNLPFENFDYKGRQ